MTVVFQASHDEPTPSRLEHWLHVVDETFGPTHLRPPGGAHTPEQLVVGDLGAVRISELRIAWQAPTAERCRGARTPKLIRQSDPDPEQYRVDLLVRGQLVVEQAGQEAALGPGDFAITDWSRPARWATATQRAVSLMFPRALLPLPHDEVARLGGQRVLGCRCAHDGPARGTAPRDLGRCAHARSGRRVAPVAGVARKRPAAS